MFEKEIEIDINEPFVIGILHQVDVLFLNGHSISLLQLLFQMCIVGIDAVDGEGLVRFAIF